MIGRRSPQRGLFEADNLFLDDVGRDTFYGFLASQRGTLFHDDDFSELYCPDNGRNSVPPSIVATALLLQTFERVSDEEAAQRAHFDLRWKVALGIGVREQPFCKSTLQLFRAQLVLHQGMRDIFQRSVDFARETGYLRKRKIKLALDTSFIRGKGAAKDAYNLLADGIVKLAKALASEERQGAADWAKAQGLGRYFGSSLKGEAAIDWEDESAREAFLREVVGDADRVLEMARQAVQRCAGTAQERVLREAADLLTQLLLQNIDRQPDGAAIKAGVSPDRIVSVHDPEMRHGRKSRSQRFDGHKVGLGVDSETQMILAVTVLAGNAPDNEQALALVEQSERSAGAEVEETIADCAYGDGETRQAFADAGRPLIARVPKRPKQRCFPKEDFAIDLTEKSCRCPAGNVTTKLGRRGRRRDRQGKIVELYAFRFPAALCDACPLRDLCVKGKRGQGRSVSLHPQEALLQEARALQASAAYAPYRVLRQSAEHRLARIVQLGGRKARYFGRTKTLFQVLMAATVANLTLVARATGLMRAPSRGGIPLCSHFTFVLGWLQALWRRLSAATSLPSAENRPEMALLG